MMIVNYQNHIARAVLVDKMAKLAEECGGTDNARIVLDAVNAVNKVKVPKPAPVADPMPEEDTE